MPRVAAGSIGSCCTVLLVDFAERAARNEEVFREVNERIEAGAELHGLQTPARFHCECDRGGCFETVELRPAEYRELLERRYHFVVAPDHADPRVERLVEERDGYWVVEKVGEAREALDRQHPHQRHQRGSRSESHLPPNA